MANCFIKYTLFPPKPATASQVAKHLGQNVFLVIGVPDTIICDNGRQNSSTFFKKVAISCKCFIQYTANYHPLANPCERIDRVIKTN